MMSLKAGLEIRSGLILMAMHDVIRGGPRIAEQTQNVIESIRAAGQVGLPVIEYTFFANRLMEGYKEEIGRGGAGYTAYDYELSKDLPPLPEVGTHTLDEMWANITYFLKAVVPVADELRGRVPDMYVSLKPGAGSDKAVQDKVIQSIETIIGKIALGKIYSGSRMLFVLPMNLHRPDPLPRYIQDHHIPRHPERRRIFPNQHLLTRAAWARGTPAG